MEGATSAGLEPQARDGDPLIRFELDDANVWFWRMSDITAPQHDGRS